MPLNRRHMLAGLAGATGSALLPSDGMARLRARVVIIGGGFGGATAAQYLRKIAPNISVTLIEPNPVYKACPFSNLVITGQRGATAQNFGYAALRAQGITVIHDKAVDVDPVKQAVSFSGASQPLPYDRLIMSPGIDMRFDSLAGYDESAVSALPHGWKVGDGMIQLRDQLADMDNGGVVVISVPRAPYRCPPGPYERASLIAHYLKTHKPRSKLIILDSKDRFSKQPLFQSIWVRDYSDVLDWRAASDDGIVTRVDAATRTVETDFETIKADVANIIPPQKAGQIAERAGTTDPTGWCPINATSFESLLQPNIHVIGDAAIATPMPKSAFSANLQGKLCAGQVVRLLSGLPPQPTVLTNTCYSYTNPDHAISITGVYRNQDGAFASVSGAGGLSSAKGDSAMRAREARHAADWFDAITQEAFG